MPRPRSAPRDHAVELPRHWARPVVRGVRPRVDDGRRAVKATVGERLSVSADAFVDGSDLLAVDLRYRHGAGPWRSVPMRALYDDRWAGEIPIDEVGGYRFAVRAVVDQFATWRRDLAALLDAGRDVQPELSAGADLIATAAKRTRGESRRMLTALSACLREADAGLGLDVAPEVAAWAMRSGSTEPVGLHSVVFSQQLGLRMRELCDAGAGAASEVVSVVAERAKARFSTWYEMMPRSASPEPGRHGTLADVRSRLDYVESLGFDVLYLPPIHPIGHSFRKGRDGATTVEPDDPGSPWAIGSADGGHTSVHPELGTLADFDDLVADAASRGIDVAVDLAFQASPDHPWVREHPEWFRHRADGTIRYAENPPKRYEDIYPFDFESDDWQGLWTALLDVVRFWVRHGVRVFRVDNPHTKPFAFWEWLLATLREESPDLIFLSEAFTRPRAMEHLARIGFTQSYTYFTWRTSKWELETYLTELCSTDVAAYLRPNLWPNTPDILTEELQSGGRATFQCRLILAATLSASYGIFGPAFELGEQLARSPGSEEYQGSEKYELRWWDLDDPRSLAPLVGAVNRIRRSHECLQFNDSLRFHFVDNDQLLAYSKVRDTAAGRDAILVVANLDSRNGQSGWVSLDLDAFGIDGALPYVLHDLVTDARYEWSGTTNYVWLDPSAVPCHVFEVSQPTSPVSWYGQ